MKNFFAAVWRMLKSNWLFKIMAIFFAVILWSYVLGVVNPVRERIVEDVTVQSNIEQLEAKGLTVSGNLSEILDSVDVKVEINQSDLKYLNNSNVFAFIDLSSISRTGEHTLRIKVNSSYGEVVDVSQSEITIIVDDLVSKPIPVTVETIGNVADGYHAFEPIITPGDVSITGARVDVEKVVSSVCYIDLDGLTKGTKESVEVILLDIDGNPIDQSLFKGSAPSVIVDLNVLAKKSVPIDTSKTLLGTDELAAGFELSGITIEPQTVEIIGEKSTLDTISSVELMQFSVSGASEDIVTLLDYNLPDGVSLLSEGQVQVYISIKEIIEVKVYEGVPLKTKNLDSGLTATFEQKKVDVTVIAGVNRIALLFKEDIVAYVDLDGLDIGTHTLNIMFDMPEGFLSENVSADISQVTVTISK
jgi:YbbR domain-containing protein